MAQVVQIQLHTVLNSNGVLYFTIISGNAFGWEWDVFWYFTSLQLSLIVMKASAFVLLVCVASPHQLFAVTNGSKLFVCDNLISYR